MSNILKLGLALGVVAFVSACGQKEEPVVIDPTPVMSEEPTYTGKYK